MAKADPGQSISRYRGTLPRPHASQAVPLDPSDQLSWVLVSASIIRVWNRANQATGGKPLSTRPRRSKFPQSVPRGTVGDPPEAALWMPFV